MTVEVRIPTILRTYTGGEKAVPVELGGGAASLSALIDDLETNHPGIKGRLVEAKDDRVDLRRFVNIYVNDEDVRFLGGLDAPVADGDQVVVLPAVAGG
jgi:molybdopterin synthase sulfur carrier subunit